MGRSVRFERARRRRWAAAGQGVLAAAVVAVAGLGASGAAGQERAKESGGEIALEFNRLEAAGEGCRLSFVFRNGLAGTIEAMALELVLFDPEGRVAGLIAIDAGRLPAGKMRVRQFDVAGTACSGIGRVLVNDVTACEGGGLAPATCLGAMKVSSRAGVELVN